MSDLSPILKSASLTYAAVEFIPVPLVSPAAV